MDSVARFESKVDRSGGPDACHPWTASLTRGGYAQFKLRGKMVRAHRVAYERAHGEVPAGLYVCHACDVRHCVNPTHLFAGTAAENNSDKETKGRGNQPRGERNPSARLTREGAEGARARLARGETQASVARSLGVSQATISGIVTGRTWRRD